MLGRSIYADGLDLGSGQHASVVEPDTFAVGDTVVSVFQVGRRSNGGADAIGWATSRDGGRTWRSGLLPALTPGGGGGDARFTHASDPVIGYDPVHGVWLASVLALTPGPSEDSDPVSALTVSRSLDGLNWEPPVVVSPPSGTFAHDKNWIVCDSSLASPFAGRCYTVWTASHEEERLAVSWSVDGGATWSPPVLADVSPVVGVQPVTRPDGALVVPYLREGRIESVRSTDGGATWEAPVVVAQTLFSPVARLRAAPLPSVEVGADGRVWLAWPDCSFQENCRPGVTTNDIALVSSADGRVWSAPRRVPLGSARAGLDFVTPGLAVDGRTAGARTRLAVVAYVLGPECANVQCPITARAVASADAGATWGPPRTLAPTTRLADAPLAGSTRMVGDYLSASWVEGRVVVPVVTAPVARYDGRYHVEALAARITAPPFVAVAVTPPRPAAGMRVRVTLTVAPAPPRGVAVRCAARLGAVPFAPSTKRRSGGLATCTWLLPRRSGGRVVRGTIAVSGVRRAFSVRVGAAATVRR